MKFLAGVNQLHGLRDLGTKTCLELCIFYHTTHITLCIVCLSTDEWPNEVQHRTKSSMYMVNRVEEVTDVIPAGRSARLSPLRPGWKWLVYLTIARAIVRTATSTKEMRPPIAVPPTLHQIRASFIDYRHLWSALNPPIFLLVETLEIQKRSTRINHACHSMCDLFLSISFVLALTCTHTFAAFCIFTQKWTILIPARMWQRIDYKRSTKDMTAAT